MDLGPGKGVAMSKQGFTDPLVSVGIQFRFCFVFREVFMFTESNDLFIRNTLITFTHSHIEAAQCDYSLTC